jgi:hypothetical protein
MSELRLISSFQPLEYTPEMIKESYEKNDGRIILRGLMQKADALNQNGRIYPKAILEREIRNYQKFINENRSLGECVPPETEIYTVNGWKSIKDIANDEVIATLNVENNELEFQRIDRKIDRRYRGPMHRIRVSRAHDVCLTPNHNILITDLCGRPKKIKSSALFDEVKNSSTSFQLFTSERLQRVARESVDVIDYDGRVYCVTVKNGTWLMKQNGHVCWTGNCDHPETSVVNLKNVSHIVREVKMEGNEARGAIEILDKVPSGQILKGLVESGVKLGISSRGVGSTKQQGDYFVVQDDFQLICFDVVSDPSTAQAFMLPEGRVITAAELSRVFNRSDRIDRIMNEILNAR